MSTGGGRGPRRLLLGGLACCALLVAVVSLALGAGSPLSSIDSEQITVLSRAVATAPMIAPASPDQNALPVAAAVVALTFGSVLVRHARAVPHHRPSGPRPTGRAPPGPFPRP